MEQFNVPSKRCQMTVIIFRYDITVTQHWGLEEVEAAVYLVVISPSENKGTVSFLPREYDA